MCAARTGYATSARVGRVIAKSACLRGREGAGDVRCRRFHHCPCCCLRRKRMRWRKHSERPLRPDAMERRRWNAKEQWAAMTMAMAGGKTASQNRRTLRLRLAAFVVAAEDHFAGRGLVDGGDGDVHGLVNELVRAVRDDHGAVIEICDALIVFFAFAQDENAHDLAREDDGLERVGKLIDVENLDALQRGSTLLRLKSLVTIFAS